MAHTDILLFAEDPSAANYVALLLPEFARRGWYARLYAAAVACEWLRAHSVPFTGTDAETDAQTLLDQVRPGCVLTGTAENPETLGLKLIAAARAASIPSVAFIDALMHAAYRLRGNTSDPLGFSPDALLVPDKATREAFTRLGYPGNRIEICGHPQYDQTLALAMQWKKNGGPGAFRARLFPDLAPGRRVLTFISEGSLRYSLLPKSSPSDYAFRGRGADNGRTKIVLEEVLDAIQVLPARPYLVFRVHPIESAADYAEYRTEIDCFSSGGSPLELCYASDLTVGMTSMLLFEAALLGRPTLAVLAREAEADWLPSVRSGATPCVANHTELRTSLARLLLEPPRAAPAADTVVSGAIERVSRVIAGVL